MTHTTERAPNVDGDARTGHGATVTVTVNGERRALPAGVTVAGLLALHGLDPRLVVVERNREILRERAAFGSLALADDDVVELVHFVGGG